MRSIGLFMTITKIIIALISIIDLLLTYMGNHMIRGQVKHIKMSKEETQINQIRKEMGSSNLNRIGQILSLGLHNQISLRTSFHNLLSIWGQQAWCQVKVALGIQTMLLVLSWVKLILWMNSSDLLVWQACLMIYLSCTCKLNFPLILICLQATLPRTLGHL